MIELGVPEEDVHVMGRILGQSTHRTAQAIVEVLARALLRPGDTEADLALRLADFAEATLPVLDRLTGAVLRLHLLDVIQREAVVRLEGERRLGRRARRAPSPSPTWRGSRRSATGWRSRTWAGSPAASRSW